MRAAALRELVLLFFAARCACRDRAVGDAALEPSLFRARLVARERRGEGEDPESPLFESCIAFLRVVEDAVPFFGVGRFTPARRALDRPIAIACLVDRAPCLPSRMWSISSLTNSPAWVLAAFPCRSSRRALSIVSWSGTVSSFVGKRSKDGAA